MRPPQQSLFRHTLCCIKLSDINFDSWVRVKLFFFSLSPLLQILPHTVHFRSSFDFYPGICPLSLSSAIWLEWYTKHRARGGAERMLDNDKLWENGNWYVHTLVHPTVDCCLPMLRCLVKAYSYFLIDLPSPSPSCSCRELTDHILPLLCLRFNSWATENGLPHQWNWNEHHDVTWDGNHTGHIN